MFKNCLLKNYVGKIYLVDDHLRTAPEHHVEVVHLVEAEDIEVEKNWKRFRNSRSRLRGDRFGRKSVFVIR